MVELKQLKALLLSELLKHNCIRQNWNVVRVKELSWPESHSYLRGAARVMFPGGGRFGF